MAKPLLSDDLWAVIELLLPPQPKGGHPRVPDRAAQTGVLFMLRSGIPSPGVGLRLGRDVLAPAARLAGGRLLGPAAPGLARPPRRNRPDRLESGSAGPGQRAGTRGGQQTGPNPTDRGKPGTKRRLVVDRAGIPVAALLTGANRHDSVPFADLVDAIPPIKRPCVQRRRRPAKLHTDKPSDSPRCRRALSRRRIQVRIARKGVESSARLGRHRWVVERTLAWLARSRRLTVRYERRADIHQAFLSLAGALSC